MANEIAVNTGTLAKTVGDLNADLEKVRSNIEKMYEAVAALDNTWDGPSNEVFRAMFMADKSAMEEICKGLKKIIDSMDTAKKEYELCENDVSQIVAAIKV